MYGINGRLLAVDLATAQISTREVPETTWREYLGGSGLGAKLLYSEFDWRADPLSPQNPLILITGLLTGTPVLASCKVSVCAKSPLTGIWGESTVGGFWGQQLKAAGYDGIILQGKAPEPVYLWVCDGKAELRPAKGIWGKQTYDTAELIKRETDEKAEVACIGPAGENLVEIASIMFGGHDSRAAGRCGMGAVMGSKNVKAIAVRGHSRPPIAKPDALTERNRAAADLLKEFAKALTDFGTAGGVPGVEANGDLPIKNWTLGSWTEKAARISGQAQAKEILVEHYACWACPIRCGKIVTLKTGPYMDTVAHGPEYETCAGFGSMLLIDDMHYIAAANDLCNRLGLDTISTSSVIAMAMELAEWGMPLQGSEEIGLSWGNGESVLKVLPMIAQREKIGEALCHGTRKLAESLGGVAREFSVECKGLEVAYHDPRAFTSMAANYATANRGGCHLEGLTYFLEGGTFPAGLIGFDPARIQPHGTELKGAIAAKMQDFMDVFNALGLCKFLMRGRIGPEFLTDWTNCVTGWELTPDELLKLGEKLHNLKRMYNVRLGISRKDDTLPPRLLTHDRKTGRAAGSLPHLGRILADYYEVRGWTPEGIPTPARLEGLGLEWLVEDLPSVPA